MPMIIVYINSMAWEGLVLGGLTRFKHHRFMNQHYQVVGPPNTNPSHAIELKYTMITGIGCIDIK